jgi:hypothetical protein
MVTYSVGGPLYRMQTFVLLLQNTKDQNIYNFNKRKHVKIFHFGQVCEIRKRTLFHSEDTLIMIINRDTELMSRFQCV